ncbi:hypothetical protein [Azospirillum argentinense]|uniref:hypothetical protein n=1 Tax=Azospirillum argentinense TaxID=2970906 RepID=UPI001585D991|nr:hypothetical protein [Azospirillum argentinense]
MVWATVAANCLASMDRAVPLWARRAVTASTSCSSRFSSSSRMAGERRPGRACRWATRSST